MALISHDSLRKKIYDYLKKQMEEGKLRPGKIINQRDLSAKLGVSRTPLRDTMIQLEAEGIVKIVPCRGIFIKRLTIQEIRDLFQMAGALEAKAYELAMPYFTEKHLNEMESILFEAEAMFEKNDFSRCNSQNEKFNDIVIDLCPNKAITKALSDIRHRLYHFPYEDPSPAAIWEQKMWEHHRIIIGLIRDKKTEELSDFISHSHWHVDDDYIRARFRYIRRDEDNIQE